MHRVLLYTILASAFLSESNGVVELRLVPCSVAPCFVQSHTMRSLCSPLSLSPLHLSTTFIVFVTLEGMQFAQNIVFQQKEQQRLSTRYALNYT